MPEDPRVRPSVVHFAVNAFTDHEVKKKKRLCLGMMMIMVMVMNAIRGTQKKKCLDEGIETFLSKFAHGIKNEVSTGVLIRKTRRLPDF